MRQLAFEEAAPGRQVLSTGQATSSTPTDSELPDDASILMERHSGTIAAEPVPHEERPEVQEHIDPFFGQQEGTVVGALLARFGPQDAQVLLALLDVLRSDTFSGFLSGIREGWDQYVASGAMPFTIQFHDAWNEGDS